MFFWSLGLYFIPYPQYLLYLIALPAVFFLYRVEVKANKRNEDIYTLGLMLALTTFLYIQQQPLQVILFPDLAFSWTSYFTNALVMVFTGIGFIRLQRWLGWSGLAIIGTILTVLGLILSFSLLSNPSVSEKNTFFFLVSFLVVLLLFSQLKNPLFPLFSAFAKLDSVSQKYYQIIIYILTIGVLQLTIIALLLFFMGEYWVLPLIALALVALLLRYPRKTALFLQIELSLLLSVMSLTVFSSIHSILLTVFTCFLVLFTFLGRHIQFQNYFNSKITFFCGLIFYLTLFQFPFWSLLGLFWLSVPFFCWIALPNRPLDISLNYRVYFWPLFSLIILACFHGSLDSHLLPYWAILCFILPLILSLFLQNKRLCHSLVMRFGKHIHLFLRQLQQTKYILMISPL
jgi:hypothetical protein